MHNDRNEKLGGVVCIYMKHDIPYTFSVKTKKRDNLDDYKTKNVPHDIQHLTDGWVHYLLCANNKEMIYNLNRSRHCELQGLLILRYFHAFPDGYLNKLHGLSQLVTKMSVRSSIIASNCSMLYNKAAMLPYFKQIGPSGVSFYHRNQTLNTIKEKLT